MNRPTMGPKSTTPSDGVVTSQLADDGKPNADAIDGRPGTMTQPTMIVRQATLNKVKAAAFDVERDFMFASDSVLF